MDKGKKKIIAGVGILGAAATAYLLIGRRAGGPGADTYTCHCGETFGTYEELVAHLAESHPGTPPPQFGRLKGRVVYADTGEGIEGAEIYVDSRYDGISQSGGSFETNYYAFGTYSVHVGASDCKRGSFEVTIDSELVEVDYSLTRAPEGAWTEGIVVRKIEAVPELVYLGGGVDIKVYIEYPLPLPQLPMTLKGTVVVNGEPLVKQWELSAYDTTHYFTYAPSQVGDYTVTAQDKSADFSVIEDVLSTYYHPSGAVRMPVCSAIVIPDVPAFWSPGVSHPGGDYIITGRSRFSVSHDSLFERLHTAIPAKWEPDGAAVQQYATLIKEGGPYTIKGTLYIVATEYESQSYWDSKEELAENIVRDDVPVPEEMCELVPSWMNMGPCPKCSGTGELNRMTCYICDGTGQTLACRVDINKGIRDWVKLGCLFVSVTGFQGMLKGWIYCPYCRLKIETGWIKGLDFRRRNKELWVARTLLNHIEDSHPNHPLTEPPWF